MRPTPPPRPPGARWISFLSGFIPRDQREDWRREWLAELAAAATGPDARSPLRLRIRSLGALADVLEVRRLSREPATMLLHHLRFAFRLLRRRPAFTTVVVLTLALGIGGGAAIYSVVNAVLLRALPYTDPDRLVMLWGEPLDGDPSKVGRWGSYPDYQDLRKGIRSFEQLAAFRIPRATLLAPGAEPRTVQQGVGTANLLATLGVEPVLGRGFRPEEDQPGAPPVVILTDQLWRRHFGADPAVLGTVVRLEGQPHTVIGVLPPRFRYADAELWTAMVPTPLESLRGAHRLQLVGRLAPGIRREDAEREARTIAADLAAAHPGDNANRSAALEPLHEATVGRTRGLLLGLLGGALLVMLIVAANVANLFLVRAAGRGREIALRTALGAGRAGLLQQFCVEAMVLTFTGVIAAVPVALWGVKALVAGAPEGLPRMDEIGLDGAALLFMATIGVVAGLLFGIVPLFHRGRGQPSLWLRDRSPGPRHGRLASGFVVLQLAIATVLVVGAGLLAKSLWRLSQVELGFNPDNLLVAQVTLPESRYGPDQTLAFYRELEERLATTAGVASVSLAMEHPLSGGWTTSFRIENGPPVPEGEEPEARVRPVAPGYFRNMGMTLTRGRDVSPQATMNAPGEVVVNEAFVARHFPGQEPLGRRLLRESWWPGQPTAFEIVGVVANERFRGFNVEADPATYFPHAQFPMNEMYVLVRTTGPAEPFVRQLREEIQRLDRELPLEEAPTMAALIREGTAVIRFNAALIGLFAVVAVLLSAMGVYGVLAQAVSQRTAEIGIRLALGADRGAVLRMIVGQGLRLSLLGAGAGLLLASGGGRLLAGQLYGVPPRDPAVFVAVGVTLTLIALAAAYLPARRASRLDPAVTLKSE